MTRKCPKCGKVYRDENLNFCLDDGATLVPFVEINDNPSDPTVVIPPDTFATTPNAISNVPQKSSSNFFLYATVVLSIIVLSGLFGLIFYFALAPKTDSASLVDSNTSNSEARTKNNETYEDNKKSGEDEKSDVGDEKESRSLPPAIGNNPQQGEPEYTPPPKPKASSSKSHGLKKYKGDIGGQNVTVNLDFKKGSKQIVGNYYFANSPGNVYEVSGSNYAEGRATLTVSDGMSNMGKINLYKTLEGRNLCWQGTIKGQRNDNIHMRFCRKR